MLFNIWSNTNYIGLLIIIGAILISFFFIIVYILQNFHKKILENKEKQLKYKKILDISKEKNKTSLDNILSILEINSSYQLASFLGKPVSFIKENKKNYNKIINLIINKLEWKNQ